VNIAWFFLRGLLAWIILGVFAVANGALGLLVIQPWAGEYGNHLYKSIVMLAFIYLVLVKFWKIVGLQNWKGRAVWLGLFLMGLSVGFEFVFFHYVIGESWQRLLADYHLWRGRLWTLVLTADLVLPYLVARSMAKAGEKPRCLKPC